MEGYEKLLLKEIEEAGEVLIGPRIVQIDLSNQCNLNCIGCWDHSPLLGDRRMSEEESKIRLPFKKVKELINELFQMGTEEIFLSGSGEPFTYPRIMEALELIKEKGMKCNIITNFTLVNSERLKKLVELGIDLITVSLWAGDAQTYIKTHPGSSEREFYRIRDALKQIYSFKKDSGRPYPQIKIYNVISRLNYQGVIAMLDFALETLVDYLEFQVVDIIPGKTDELALSEEEKKRMIEEFQEMRQRVDFPFELGDSEKQISELKEFGRFFKPDTSHTPKFSAKDFKFESWYDPEDGYRYFKLTCPAGGWTTVHNLKGKENKLVLIFPDSGCTKCEIKNRCIEDYKGRQVVLEYLKLLGFGSFYRRISSEGASEGSYDKVVDSIPCYAGYIYTRILSNGDVIPCCKAHLVPMGNIYSQSFKEIWHSPVYGEFRYKANNFKKSDSYFKKINCYKSCDNLGMNLETHRKVLESKGG